MPMRVRAVVSVALLAIVFAVASGCSRENQEWHSAQAADTIEGYDDFVGKHPQSEFAEQAKTRVKQLSEERDWERATVADTADAYQQFLAQHAEGKWAQEAHIRVENFNVLDGSSKGAAATAGASAAAAAAAGAAKGGAASAATPAAIVKPVAAPQPATKAATKAALAPKSVAAPKPAMAPKPATTTKSATRPAAKAAPKSTHTHTRAAAKSHAATTSGGGSGSSRIQLGAFSTEAKANQEWQRIAGKFAELKGLSPQITSVKTANGKLYRLQVGVSSRQRGRDICSALSAQKQGCISVH